MIDNPFEVFKEDMENEEVFLRVNAMHRIRIVCTLIGVDNIKSQLIPYFELLLKREEDEVLFAMAEELGNIAEIIPSQSQQLLNLLEKLAEFDETVVRDQAVKSISQVCQLLSDLDVVKIQRNRIQEYLIIQIQVNYQKNNSKFEYLVLKCKYLQIFMKIQKYIC